MSIRVRIPTQLRPLAGGAGEVEVEGATVGDALKGLDALHPGFGERLFDDGGNLRRFVNVFVGEEDIRFLDGLGTPVPAGAVVSVVPAVAGGQ
jgi:sulfur-carrier protein